MEDSVKDRILAYIKAKNLSQKRFEQAANLSNGYVSNLRHAPSAEKVSAILSAFPDINRTWLLTGDGSMLTTDAPAPFPVPQHAVPVYDGDVTCNLSETRTYSDMPIEGYIDLPLVSKGTIVLKAHGESMVPTVNDGDYIAMRPLQSWDYIMYGNIYVVELPEYRALKRVRKGSDEDHIILRSDNDDYDDVEVPKSDIRSLWVVENIISIKKLF